MKDFIIGFIVAMILISLLSFGDQKNNVESNIKFIQCSHQEEMDSIRANYFFVSKKDFKTLKIIKQ